MVLAEQSEEPTCSVKGGSEGKSCLPAGPAPSTNASCAKNGFDPLRLACGTCRKLGQRLEETGHSGHGLLDECLGCCKEAAAVERFSSARLIADADIQGKDQDLHDFIKRKAPLFSQLEVEYMENAEPAVEFESDTDPDRVLRAVVSGWKSNHLGQFLSERLEDQGPQNNSESAQGGAVMAAQGAWTAEVQTCSG